VLAFLAQGHPPDEIAAILGVSISTVRSHLRDLFGRTGTTRQAELVARTLSLASPLRSVTNPDDRRRRFPPVWGMRRGIAACVNAGPPPKAASGEDDGMRGFGKLSVRARDANGPGGLRSCPVAGIEPP
jgi:hypothetical protein